MFLKSVGMVLGDAWVPHRGGVFHYWSYKCDVELYQVLGHDAGVFED